MMKLHQHLVNTSDIQSVNGACGEAMVRVHGVGHGHQNLSKSQVVVVETLTKLRINCLHFSLTSIGVQSRGDEKLSKPVKSKTAKLKS